MIRRAYVRLPPLAWVGIAAASVASLRFLVALQVRTPIYYPDEYRTTELARAIAEGSLPHIRGGPVEGKYISYIPTILQAPAWLIGDVDVAYRLAQAFGCIAFSAAAFPVYLIARRIGIGGAGSVLAAVLALLVPAGAYSYTLLAEPYAYPAFFVCVLLGVRALAQPSSGRQATTVAAIAGLFLVGGLQFISFAIAYVSAWLLLRASQRGLVRRKGILTGAALAVVALVVVALGPASELILRYAHAYEQSPRTLVWIAINALVLGIAAGWALVPGAVLGFRELGRSTVSHERSFAVLGSMLLLALVVEAGIASTTWDLHERLTFYGAPLLSVAFVWYARRSPEHRLTYAAVSYVAAIAVLLLPTMPEFLGPRDHTPSLLGLFELTSGDEIGPIVWAPALALLAVGTAWRGASSPRAVAITAAGLCALIGIGTSAKFVSVSRVAEPTRLALPSNATYLTWVGGGTVTLWETLFWNPQVNRVAVLGVGGAPDGYAFVRARLAPGARLVDEAGSVLAGPYVIGPEVVALGARTLSQKTGAVALLPTAPSAIVFGLHRQPGRLGIAGLMYATATRPSTLNLELRSPGSRRTAHLRCDDGLERKIDLGSQRVSVLLRLSPTIVRSCRFFIVGAVGAEATIRLGQ